MVGLFDLSWIISSRTAIHASRKTIVFPDEDDLPAEYKAEYDLVCYHLPQFNLRRLDDTHDIVTCGMNCLALLNVVELFRRLGGSEDQDLFHHAVNHHIVTHHSGKSEEEMLEVMQKVTFDELLDDENGFFEEASDILEARQLFGLEGVDDNYRDEAADVLCSFSVTGFRAFFNVFKNLVSCRFTVEQDPPQRSRPLFSRFL